MIIAKTPGTRTRLVLAGAALALALTGCSGSADEPVAGVTPTGPVEPLETPAPVDRSDDLVAVPDLGSLGGSVTAAVESVPGTLEVETDLDPDETADAIEVCQAGVELLRTSVTGPIVTVYDATGTAMVGQNPDNPVEPCAPLA